MAQVKVNKKGKQSTRAELEALSKSELIDKVLQLDAHVAQLKNLLHKTLNGEDGKAAAQTDSRAGKRKFDFSKCHKRHVLLKLLYFGWDYNGLAVQEDSNATIEYHLFQALERTCLIESRATANYHRCGRTDKQVSAFCQVISIDLRSKFPDAEQHSADALANEIDYCGILNRVLPQNIQCIAWRPLHDPAYSARFDCAARTYRYYFAKGDLDIDAMRVACTLLIRHADFRNFCKMDVNNGVTNYMRHIQGACIKACKQTTDSTDDGYGMYFLEIRANAFLWHQIRCIMAVLLLIGQRHEEPQIVSDLLDIDANPCKPQYTPALALPLNLFHCEFNAEQIHKAVDSDHSKQAEQIELPTAAWLYNEANLRRLIRTVQQEWLQYSVKCTMIRDVLSNLEDLLCNEFDGKEAVRTQALALQDGNKSKTYQKLLSRKRCESLENRIEHYVKKQRLQLAQSVTDA